MDSVSPYPIGPGQRTLAAIVFTDVVNFSRRMHREEVVTLKLVEQDFELMRQLGEKHAGSVLKTTGDGLLLYFISAVQAVGYALKLQRHFAERARSNPAAGNLVHRIGIHLGDVFVKDQDVMGDGVNTAARLQAEADPGGICISQTVYDVVKSKLELEVARLTPRGPKSIAESVTIYRVLLEPAAVRPAPAAPLPVYTAPPPPAQMTRARKLAALGVLALVFAGVAGLVLQAQRKHEEELARSRAAQAEMSRALLVAKEADPPGGQAPGETATTAANPDETPPAERIRELLEWLNGVLPRYTRSRPLLLRELPGTIARDAKLFTDVDHRLYFAEGGAVRQRNLAELQPDALGAVIVSVLLDAPEPPSKGVRQGAEAFAKANGLPEMLKMLEGKAEQPQP
ncbi:MAG TPA: adenylate/guanylate cyclase domain-containing protein [Lacunisphaera sp.]|nr:adenylate/guanylate cyclase domain-containing protein [Lacunisphaera sp.]